MVPLPARAASPKPAWVIPETLNVRSGPRQESKKIGSLSRGAKVYVLSFSNKWCWCSLPGGGKGWIAEWLLQFSADKGRALAQSRRAASPVAAAKGTPPAWINVSAANVRSAPGLGGKSYGTLDSGTKIYVLGRQGDWVKCKTPGGSGWVRGDLLEYNVSAGRKLAAAGGAALQPAQAPKPTASTSTHKAFVIEDKVTLRSGPGSRFDKKATVVKGQTLYVSGSKDQWRKVTVHGGHSGWVAAWLIKEDKPRSAPASGGTPEVARTDKVLTAWVTATTAHVRERPSCESRAKFQVKQGTKVQVAAVSGHWCKVRTMSGNYGWIAGWLIKFVPPGSAITATEAGEKVEVNVGWVARPVVNLRTGPSTESPTSGEAKLSTRVLIIGKKPGWYKVVLDDGSIGWMASRLIDTRAERQVRHRAVTGEDSSTTSAVERVSNTGQEDFPSPTAEGGSGDDSCQPNSVGGRLVATARKYLGAAYISGSSRPGAFDCSGFTSYVHRVHGIGISRSSRTQFREGSPVARDDLQPGDVLFFENTYRRGISHVGLYMGGGRFIHAANHSCGVKITDLDDNYYARRYVGARRMY
jgi:cell wall-associated NlpC family hydrolase